jgi:uncharacterized membrane protein YfcA
LIALVALAALLIGFGKAGVAGTLGPLVTVLMALALPADDALGVLLPMLIVADGFAVGAYWRRWEARLLPRLVGAALVGIALGTAVVSSIDEAWLQRLIAVSMLVFAALYFRGRRLRFTSQAERSWAVAAGSVSGFTSTVAHAGGPPIVVYLLMAGLAPATFVATSVAFFAIVNLIKVPGYFYAGLFDGQLILSTVWAWLFIPVGVGLGRLLVDRIDRGRFEIVTVILLVAGSLVLLVI